MRSADIHKARFSKGVMVKYKVSIVNDQEYTETKLVVGTLTPEFNHTRIVGIDKIKQEHLDFFDTGCITFCVYGKQEDIEGDPRLAKLTTKVGFCVKWAVSRPPLNIIIFHGGCGSCGHCPPCN